MKRNWKTFLAKRENGQILVIMGLIFIGLIAVIGLAIDLGLVFVAYSPPEPRGGCRRAGRHRRIQAQLPDYRNARAARQLLNLNGVNDTNSTLIQIDTCKSLPERPRTAAPPPAANWCG